MRCPYCVSEINDAAIVCPCCQRDLYLFRPLLERISCLERELQGFGAPEGIYARIAALEARVKSVDPAPLLTVEAMPAQHEPPKLSNRIQSFVISGVLLASLLILAHAMIVTVYDLNMLYLRVASLVIPLPFGIIFGVASLALGRRRFLLGLGAGTSIALVAVLGMSWTTHLVDHVPVLPADQRELREFIEYAASIAFSYVTGMLLAGLWQAKTWRAASVSENDLALKLAKLASSSQAAVESVQALSLKIKAISTSVAATGTSVAAAYTGLRAVVGG
jgi:hypothetical protein